MKPDTLAPDAAENPASDGTKFTVNAFNSLLQGEDFFSGVRLFYVCGDVKYLTFFQKFFDLSAPLYPIKILHFPRIQKLQHRFSKPAYLKVLENVYRTTCARWLQFPLLLLA